MPDTITWFEIGTDDPATAERFYGDVFGWTVEPGLGPSYRFLGTGEGGLRGGLADTGGAIPGYAIFTVQVEDVAETCRRAEEAGGKTLRPPAATPNGLRFAYLLDPAGNQVGVFTPPPAPR